MKINPESIVYYLLIAYINSYAIDDTTIQNETETGEDGEEVYELSDFNSQRGR